jgi:excisionase family DNA binding protein
MMSMNNQVVGGGPVIRVSAVTDGGQEDFITKEEVARRLKKTTRTIENWQKKGHIPFVKVQQSVLFRWSSVVAELERKFGSRVDG